MNSEACARNGNQPQEKVPGAGQIIVANLVIQSSLSCMENLEYHFGENGGCKNEYSGQHGRGLSGISLNIAYAAPARIRKRRPCAGRASAAGRAQAVHQAFSQIYCTPTAAIQPGNPLPPPAPPGQPRLFPWPPGRPSRGQCAGSPLVGKRLRIVIPRIPHDLADQRHNPATLPRIRNAIRNQAVRTPYPANTRSGSHKVETGSSNARPEYSA